MAGDHDLRVTPLDITLSLDRPVRIGSGACADSAGNARWILPVPPGAAGRVVWFRAAQMENAGNLLRASRSAPYFT